MEADVIPESPAHFETSAKAFAVGVTRSLASWRFWPTPTGACRKGVDEDLPLKQPDEFKLMNQVSGASFGRQGASTRTDPERMRVGYGIRLTEGGSGATARNITPIDPARRAEP